MILEGFGRTVRSTNSTSRLLSAHKISESSWIPRGSGLAYGDASLPVAGVAIQVDRCEPVLVPNLGGGSSVRVSAGLTIGELSSWLFDSSLELPVVPGSGRVTIGGAIASDVHGKNQHREGTFGGIVQRLVLLQDEKRFEVVQGSDLFPYVVGAMGMSGIVVEADLQVRACTSGHVDISRWSGWGSANLLDCLMAQQEQHEYIVAWVDWTVGKRRGSFRWVVEAANSAKSRDTNLMRPKRASSANWVRALPTIALSPSTAAFQLINEVIFKQMAKTSNLRLRKTDFLFPLDRIPKWNQFIGRRGFIEYQFVVPICNAEKVMQSVLELIVEFEAAPFFSGAKIFRDNESVGLLSFCRSGLTVSLDVLHNSKSREMLEELDHVIVGAGGRVYLAKDSTLSAETFRMMYPDAAEIEALRSTLVNPPTSMMTRRLGIR